MLNGQLDTSAVRRRGSILSRVPTKPFNTNYIVNMGVDRFVAINGEQVVKIDVDKVFVYGQTEHQWQVTFYLSNGETHVISPSPWTTNFVRETFSGS